MKRNIYGCQMIIDDPVNIMIAHIGQRHIITLQKGQSGIVILKIQSIPHTRRHLVDKAEHALIPAGTVLIHKAVDKGNSQILFQILFDLQLPFLTIRFSYQHGQVLIICQIMIIKYIFYWFTVNGNKLIPRLDLQLIRYASFGYCTYHMLLHTLSSCQSVLFMIARLD